jgi:hypothetical protein
MIPFAMIVRDELGASAPEVTLPSGMTRSRQSSLIDRPVTCVRCPTSRGRIVSAKDGNSIDKEVSFQDYVDVPGWYSSTSTMLMFLVDDCRILLAS